MCECKSQGAVSAHGEAGNASGFAVANDAVVGFDVGNELGEEEITVAVAVVGGVDEKAATAIGRDHDEVTDLVLLAKIFDQPPAAAAQHGLLVLAEAVKKIKRWVLLVCVGLVTWRQHHAIADFAVEDVAGQSGAVGAALGKC